MPAGAPKGNTNAEKWTLEEAVAFMELSIETCKIKGFDFIGEVATELDTYRDVFTMLKRKFKECEILYKRLVQLCESNCFSHSKKGEINTAVGIVNLKSNHGWTDRVANDHSGELKVETITGTKVT